MRQNYELSCFFSSLSIPKKVSPVLAAEIKTLQLELQNSKEELSESEESKQKLSEALTESQKREKELDEILHDMQSENLSLTRNYGEAKKELGEVTKKLRGLEEDFANTADSSEMSKQILNQMKNELEILRAENLTQSEKKTVGNLTVKTRCKTLMSKKCIYTLRIDQSRSKSFEKCSVFISFECSHDAVSKLVPVRVPFSKSIVFKICRHKMRRFRANGRHIRHIFHQHDMYKSDTIIFLNDCKYIFF